VSKAALKSNKTRAETLPLSMEHRMSFVTRVNAVSVEWCGRYNVSVTVAVLCWDGHIPSLTSTMSITAICHNHSIKVANLLSNRNLQDRERNINAKFLLYQLLVDISRLDRTTLRDQRFSTDKQLVFQVRRTSDTLNIWDVTEVIKTSICQIQISSYKSRCICKCRFQGKLKCNTFLYIPIKWNGFHQLNFLINLIHWVAAYLWFPENQLWVKNI